jgi:hypothetical protein
MTTRLMTPTMSKDELTELMSPYGSTDTTVFDPRQKGDFQFNDGRMVFALNDREYLLTSAAYTKLGNLAGIPKSYLVKTPHEIMVPHVNYWLRNKGLAQMSMTATGDVIQFFHKGEAHPVPNEKIIDACEDTFGKDFEAWHVSHDWFRSQFSIMSDAFENAVAVGDVVRVGVSIDNSYAMQTPLKISTYIHRLVCTNGAISADNVFQLTRHSGDDDSSDTWLRESITQAVNSADMEVERLRSLSNISVADHVSASLDSVFSEFGVPYTLRQEVMDQVMDNTVVSLYDLYNIITNVASHSPASINDPDLAARMMRIGGQIASHPEICDACHRVI